MYNPIDFEKYQLVLEKQAENSQKPTPNIYYRWLYSLIGRELKPEKNYLEIGAGAGVSAFFLGEFKITRTDFMPWPERGVLGSVDAQKLPFEDNSFDGVIGMDMIHHVENPSRLISEALRVTAVGGKLVFVEPYVSLLSYPIYKFFHEEKATIPRSFNPDYKWVTDAPSDGDQSVAQRLFCSSTGKKYLRGTYGSSIVFKVDFLNPFSFYLTGGLNHPTSLNPAVIGKIVMLESALPRRARALLGSRMILIITKLR